MTPNPIGHHTFNSSIRPKVTYITPSCCVALSDTFFFQMKGVLVESVYKACDSLATRSNTKSYEKKVDSYGVFIPAGEICEECGLCSWGSLPSDLLHRTSAPNTSFSKVHAKLGIEHFLYLRILRPNHQLRG